MKVDFVFPVTPVLNAAGQVMTSHRSIADAVEAATDYPEGDYTYTIPIRLKVQNSEGVDDWVPAGIEMSPGGDLPHGFYGDSHGVFAGQAVDPSARIRSVTDGVEVIQGGIPIGQTPFVYELEINGVVTRHVYPS